MRYTFTPITPAEAASISQWRYPEPYHVYSMTGDDAIEEMLDPNSPYFAARDETGGLAGFFAFGSTAEVQPVTYAQICSSDGSVTVGLGLHPDVMGNGRGLEYVLAGLKFGQRQFAPRAFRLYALTWNVRAITVYERAGFAATGIISRPAPEGMLEFLEMWRLADL